MKRRSNTAPLVSIVLPACNEEENIALLYQQLAEVAGQLPYRFEFIFVDDGSTDETWSHIGELALNDVRVKGISFSRNFGHQAALIAGLEHAEGEAVITMDADLQHPPRLIPELIRHWEEGNDLVLTIRDDTEGVSRIKVWMAKWFYAVINKIGNIDIPPNAADFRLMTRPVVEQLRHFEERALFLRGLVQWVGFRRAEINYVAERRHAGTTKYSWKSMFRFALDGITSFSNAPLYFSIYFGALVSLCSFIYGMYAVYIRVFTDTAVLGWTSILVAVLFLGGVQLITIGIIGLYIGKVYAEIKHRPRYIIRNILGEFSF